MQTYPDATFYFPRPLLSKELFSACAGSSIFNARSGLFLAAQRRVGKTTFIRNELVPYFESQGWYAIYIDLWELRGSDPAEAIRNAIINALDVTQSTLSKSIKGRNKLSIDVLGAKLEIGTETQSKEGESIHSLLLRLTERTKKPIALFVDEAQKALLTKAGKNALFGLKSARDQLNLIDKQRLALVFTGSHQAKLRQMTLASSEPFYLATILDFPLLGKSYVEGLLEGVNKKLFATEAINVDEAWRAFELIGQRPELLNKAIARYVFSHASEVTLLGSAHSVLDELYAEQLYWLINDASALCKALLRSLAEKEQDGFPATAIEALGKAIRVPVTRSQVQTALNTLMENGLVMRTANGTYILEDAAMGAWLMRKSKS